MTEEGANGDNQAQDSFQSIRDEFAKQIAELKEAHSKEIDELNKKLTAKEKDYKALESEVVRNTVQDPAPKTVEKTAEEIESEKYQAEVKARTDKALKYRRYYL